VNGRIKWAYFVHLHSSALTAHPEIGRPPYLAALARSILSDPTAERSYPADTKVQLALYTFDGGEPILEGEWNCSADTLGTPGGDYILCHQR
jgi:hypothetical protein